MVWLILTLGTAGRHGPWRVVSTELLHAEFADLATYVGEHIGNHGFKRLVRVTTWFVLQRPSLRLVDEHLALGICLIDQFLLFAREKWAGRDVVNADGEPKVRCKIPSVVTEIAEPS
jgi:hypothetical protein